MTTINQIKQHLRACIQAGITPMLEGSPGAGKTAVCQQIALELGLDYLPIVMSVRDPVDTMGLPTVNHDMARFLPFGDFARIYRAEKPLLVVFDDLGQAPNLVQASIMQIIHGRRLNEHEVPRHVRFILATNRPKDRAGVQQVISPIRGRVITFPFTSVCHCSAYETCSWHEWAQGAGIHPAVQAFVKWRPACLAEYDGDNVDHSQAVCSARAMEFLSRLELVGIHDPVDVIIEGAIGPNYGPEYIAFRTMYQALPMVSDIERAPETTPVPSQTDQQIAISCAITQQVKAGNAEPLLKYLIRLPVEFATYAIMSSIQRVPEITHSRTFVTWASQNAQHLLAA